MGSIGQNSNETSSSETLAFLVEGVLDAEYRLPAIPQSKISKVEVNWQSLDYVNSAGIVTWMTWVANLRQAHPNTVFYFKNCPAFMAHIFNSVNGFIPKNSFVLSLEVPFQCEKCGRGDNQTLSVNLERVSSGFSFDELEAVLRKQACDTTGCQVSLDVAPSHFRFLKKIA